MGEPQVNSHNVAHIKAFLSSLERLATRCVAVSISEGFLYIQPVADNNTEEKKTSVADDESKRWRKGKGAAHRVEERAQAAYAYILEGGTRIQICEKLASRFGTSIRTGHEDYRRAMELLKEEQTGTREELLNQLQALRLATVQKALKRGHFQTVATLLGDMGRVIGEAAPEQLALQVPTLDIKIEGREEAG